MACLIKIRMSQFGRGWTYSFHSGLTSARAAVDLAYGVRNLLIKVHDAGTFIKWISATNLLERDTWRQEVRLNPAKAGSAFEADADEVSTAARVRFFTSGNKSRFLWLRGLADTAVKEDQFGQSLPNGPWKTRLDAFIDAVGGQASSWAIQTIKAPVGNYRFIDVLSIAAEVGSNSKNSVFTLREEPPFAAGDRVIFKRDVTAPELLPFKNSHLVRAVSVENKTLTINASYKGSGATLAPVDMKVRWQDFDYAPITGGEFIEFGSKQTGPDDAPAGRASGVSFRHV